MAIAPTLGQNGCSTGWNVTFDPASGNLMAGGRVVSLSESELAALRAWVTSTAGLDSVGYDTASGTIKSEGVSVTLNQVENTAVRALLADAITRTEADAAYADKATEDLAALAESTAVQAKSAVEALAEKAVTAEVDPVTGGIGILGPDGAQIAGNAAPYTFTTRALSATDNGMNLVCATAQTATINADLPVGFGCSFEGAISFTAGAGVTISDLRNSGATDVFCGIMAVGANTYKVRGGKA